MISAVAKPDKGELDAACRDFLPVNLLLIGGDIDTFYRLVRSKCCGIVPEGLKKIRTEQPDDCCQNYDQQNLLFCQE